MASAKSAKKQTNPLVYIGIGCAVLVVFLSILAAVIGNFVAKRFIGGIIESKTGIKTNLKDIESGKMSFTDPKTGAKVDVGTGKIPETFPKDFPVYPGATVTSSLSGAESGKANGFWLTLSTKDSVDAVAAFYKKQFADNGWVVGSTYTSGDTSTQTVTKSTWNGSLAITSAGNSGETQIVIILGQDE